MAEKEWLEGEQRICKELFTESEREYLKFGLHIFLYNKLEETKELLGEEMEKAQKELARSYLYINNILEKCDLERWTLPFSIEEEEEN